MTFPVLETKRLLLREITIADAANLFSFFSDPQVMRFYDCAATREPRRGNRHHSALRRMV
jgi:ribosomal-protein-alanine N-acetyltransferase